MRTAKLKVTATQAVPVKVHVQGGEPVPMKLSVARSVVPARDYDDLTNKPSINEVELVGNKTFEELGDSPLTNSEIHAIYARVFH